jgi:cytochrome c-type biogenesis protein
MDFSNIGIGLAFLAGLASFLSPCVFSLVPAYVGYLGGRTVASARGGKHDTWVGLSHGLAFVLGFSVVFISLGVATSALGGLLYDMRTWLARIGGIVVIIFGLHMTGLIRIPFLEYDLRPQSAPDRNRGYLASFLMGIFFSAGWSPCVGPILGSILTISISGGSISQGVVLLTAYSAGLAIPFLVASVQIGLVTIAIQRYGKAMHYVEIGMGVVLILVGLLLFSGRFEQLASLGSFFGVYDELALGRTLLIILVSLILLGLIPAYIAKRKGRSFMTWWFFGATLFPVALPMAWLLGPAVSLDPIDSGATDGGEVSAGSPG